jgi:hypothetical protein
MHIVEFASTRAGTSEPNKNVLCRCEHSDEYTTATAQQPAHLPGVLLPDETIARSDFYVVTALNHPRMAKILSFCFTGGPNWG